MPWFKVDDNLAFHAKVVAAGNPAMGLWVRAGSWCAQQLTDGFIAGHMLAALGTTQQAKRLVEVGLWERRDDGYAFHEWTERQPSRGDIEAERSAARDRMRDLRAKKKGVKRTPSAQVREQRAEDVQANTSRSSGEVRDSFALPDPVPVPVPTRPSKELSRKTSASQIEIADNFNAFWDAYGKKVDRGKALRAFKGALKKVDAQTLIAAAAEHAEWHRREGTEARFIKHPTSWLNAECWADERTARNSSPRDPKQAATDDLFDAAMRRAVDRERNSA